MLIDINTGFGGRESIQQFGIPQLRAELDKTPTSLALVHGYQGAIDHTSANDAAFSLAQEDSRFQVCGTLDPRDVFTWRDELARCLDLGVRLFTIAPAKGGWSPDSILAEMVIGQLAGRDSALLVDTGSSGFASRLASIAEQHRVPIIFSEARYFPLTELLPLAQRNPFVFIETSRLTSPDGIELCVQELGADRLLYGSGAPRYPAYVSWQLLQSARISESERSAIAAGNAVRLLGLKPPTVEPSPITIDPLGEAVDVHLHDKFPGAPFPPFSPTMYEKELGRNEILGGVCSSITAITWDIAQGNDEVAAMLDTVDRLRGYVVVDPRYPQESRQQLLRLEQDPRFAGVKIHCMYSKTPSHADSMLRLFEDIAPYGKPVLIHNRGADWPEALGRIANRFPDLPLIAAHAGYGDAPHPTHDAAQRVAAYDNIVIEFCSTYLAPGAIRRGIEAVGIDRVLFGSDFPLISLPYMRLCYEDAELSPSESRRIRLENPLRLFPSLESLTNSA